jgi:hypothetical protein
MTRTTRDKEREKEQRARTKARRDYLYDHLILWSDLLPTAKGERRREILLRMWSAIRELSGETRMNKMRRQAMVEVFRECCIGEPTDINLSGKCISMSEIDLDTDALARKLFW